MQRLTFAFFDRLQAIKLVSEVMFCSGGILEMMVMRGILDRFVTRLFGWFSNAPRFSTWEAGEDPINRLISRAFWVSSGKISILLPAREKPV